MFFSDENWSTWDISCSSLHCTSQSSAEPEVRGLSQAWLVAGADPGHSILNFTFLEDLLGGLSGGDLSLAAVGHAHLGEPWAALCPLPAQHLLQLPIPGPAHLQAQVLLLAQVLLFPFLGTFPEVFYVFPEKADSAAEGICQKETGPLLLQLCFHLRGGEDGH